MNQETVANHHFCRNCGHALDGLYCKQCGQKDKEYKPNASDWIQTLWDDFVAVDKKFISTIKALVIPGRYACDWLDGKQNRYIPPIRLYIFISMFYALAGYLGDVLGADSGTLSQFMLGFSEGLFADPEAAAEKGQQVIQLITTIILPITILSAKLFRLNEKLVVSVLFVISLSTSILLFLALIDFARLLIDIPSFLEALALVLIVAFSIASAMRCYKISVLGAFIKTVFWFLINFFLLTVITAAFVGFNEAHERSQIESSITEPSSGDHAPTNE